MDIRQMEKRFEDASNMLFQDEPNLMQFYKIMREAFNEISSLMAMAGITTQKVNISIRPSMTEGALALYNSVIGARVNDNRVGYLNSCIALWDVIKPFVPEQPEAKEEVKR